MIELKAELTKKKREYEESKKNPRPVSIAKKPITAVPSKGSVPPQITEEEIKKSRDALEAKSRLYEKLEKGKLMESDLNASQRENLLVDFAWKGWNPKTEDFEFDIDSDSDSDESEGVNTDNPVARGRIGVDQVFELINNSSDSDRWIEYEDEFGRIRVTKLSHLRQIQKERQEVNQLQQLRSSTPSHYDGDAEVRNKGVGFYRFAADEEERQRQMRELKKLREETVEKRMRSLLMKEERRLRIESRLTKLKERKSQIKPEEEK